MLARWMVFLICSAALLSLGSKDSWAQISLNEINPEALVELQSRDGSTTLVGELVSVENGFYILKTEIGELRISIASAVCVGDRCPAQSESVGFAIHVASSLGLSFASEMIRSYAESTGAEVEQLESEDPNRQIVKLSRTGPSQGTEIVYYTDYSGFLAMANGEAQLALSDHRIGREVENIISGPAIERIRSAEFESNVAMDGIIVAVNPSNPVRNLSSEEINQIFTGEISNWLELGGGNVPISIFALSQDHIRGSIFAQRMLGQSGELARNVSLLNSDNEVLAGVQSERGAIGFLSRASARRVKPVTIREGCGLLTAPSTFQIKIDGYPLTYPVYLYRRPGIIHPEAETFFDWMTGYQAQPAIRSAGYIDREPERMRLEDMGMMLIHTAAVEPDFSPAQYGDMLRELRDAERLSLTFRFQSGSSDLDERSLLDLEELGRRMEAGEFIGFELLIVGFADAIGPQAENTRLAADRAQSVRNILTRAVSAETTSRLRLRTLSYGELLPVACNQDVSGRERNRRVEIWLRRPGVRPVGR